MNYGVSVFEYPFYTKTFGKINYRLHVGYEAIGKKALLPCVC